MIGYVDDEDITNLHLFNPKSDSRKMFLDFSKNAAIILKQELDEIAQLNSSFKWETEKRDD